MNQRLFPVSMLVSFGVVAAFLSILATRNAAAGGQQSALVRLQFDSPGAAQIGNLNITGSAVAGSLRTSAFNMPTGASAGKVIKSDGAGTGTWQTDGLTLPFNGSGTANWPNGVFTVSNNADGRGIYGISTAASGVGVEGRNTNQSGLGYGVLGLADGLSGIGVLGGATNTGSTTGVHGYAYSTSGTGVSGYVGATSGATVGVEGESKSPTGTGVYGIGSSDSGGNYGVHGKTMSTAGIGVYGEATDTNGGNAGGYFISISGTGVGVYGVATANGTNIGVWGITNAAAGWGVYSDGRLGASGTKLFRIDHPLDPSNKWLQHYCAEGPEPLNVYSGSVITNERGFAAIQLPDYFDEINRDPRVQLTVNDESEDFVMAKVVGDVKDCSFRIRTSKPAVKVYWEVKGTRNDLWVQKYGAAVEPEKNEREKGKYQHPELYGLPKEMGMHYREQRPTPRDEGVASTTKR